MTNYTFPWSSVHNSKLAIEDTVTGALIPGVTVTWINPTPNGVSAGSADLWVIGAPGYLDSTPFPGNEIYTVSGSLGLFPVWIVAAIVLIIIVAALLIVWKVLL